MRVWSLPDAANPVDLPVHGSATVGFTPDHRWLVTGDTEAYRFWKTGSWQLDREVPSRMGELYGRMAFSQRQTAFAIACNRDELKVLDPDTLDEMATPDFDREVPLCFDPYGMIMVTTGQSGTFFWKLDALRSGLAELGLDWKIKPIPQVSFPVVRRVLLPAAGD